MAKFRFYRIFDSGTLTGTNDEKIIAEIRNGISHDVVVLDTDTGIVHCADDEVYVVPGDVSTGEDKNAHN